MIEKKFKHLRLLAERKDFDQILFLQNQDDDTFNTLRRTQFNDHMECLEKGEDFEDDDFTGIELAIMLKQMKALERRID